MFNEISNRIEKTWSDVKSGNASSGEKLEFAAEAVGALVGGYALARFGLSRALSTAMKLDKVIARSGEQALLGDAITPGAQSLLRQGEKLEHSGQPYSTRRIQQIILRSIWLETSCSSSFTSASDAYLFDGQRHFRCQNSAYKWAWEPKEPRNLPALIFGSGRKGIPTSTSRT